MAHYLVSAAGNGLGAIVIWSMLTSAEAQKKAAEAKARGYSKVTFTNASTGKQLTSVEALLRDDRGVERTSSLRVRS